MSQPRSTARPFDRPFRLEVFFSKWEFTARYNLCGTDMQSMRLNELLDLATPDDREAFDRLYLGYTETWGRAGLREALADTFERLDAKNILCFAGSEESIFCIMHAILSKDDHAVVVGPCYQSAETVPVWLCETTTVPLDENADWALDLDRLNDAVRPNTRLIYINFPNNPTGKLIAAEDLAAVVEIARRRGVYLVSDEIFRGSERRAELRLPQVADIYERGVSLSGTSKTYGLAGLRIGWAASLDADLLQRAERIKHYLSICSSGPSEMLTMIAVKARRKIIGRNAALAAGYLDELERFFSNHRSLFEWKRPDGGFFGFPKYLGSQGVEQFANDAVEGSGVLLAPASLFASDITSFSRDRFRIGFNRPFMGEALKALDEFLAG